MAINGIVTAREAQVVANELDRIVTNGTMLALMMSLDPETRAAAGAIASVFKGMADFANDLKEACEGKQPTEEVFATASMEMQSINAMAAVENYMDGLKP
jgi:hypothetical protein